MALRIDLHLGKGMGTVARPRLFDGFGRRKRKAGKNGGREKWYCS